MIAKETAPMTMLLLSVTSAGFPAVAVYNNTAMTCQRDSDSWRRNDADHCEYICLIIGIAVFTLVFYTCPRSPHLSFALPLQL